MEFNYSIKKNIICLLALQPFRFYATVNGLIFLSDSGRKAVIKFNPSTKLFSIGIMHHLNIKDTIIKDVPLDRVIPTLYKQLGKSHNWMKYLAAWV